MGGVASRCPVGEGMAERLADAGRADTVIVQPLRDGVPEIAPTETVEPNRVQRDMVPCVPRVFRDRTAWLDGEHVSIGLGLFGTTALQDLQRQSKGSTSALRLRAPRE
jgi:hypothetical protein